MNPWSSCDTVATSTLVQLFVSYMCIPEIYILLLLDTIDKHMYIRIQSRIIY